MCFSLQWWEDLLIWAVIVLCIIAILRVLIPWVFGQFGGSLGPLPTILNYVIVAVICIFVIYIAFSLIACLLGGGGLSLFPRH